MRKSGWTPERRAKQAEAIRQWQPWGRATGPRTDEGKAKSSRNADKGVGAFQARMLQARLKWRAEREAVADQACRLLLEVRR